MADVNYGALEKKYADFYAPAFEIILDGTKIDGTSGTAVTNIRVLTSTSIESDTATFTMTNVYDAEKNEFTLLDSTIQLGKNVEIKLGYKDQLTTVFVGYITAIHIESTDAEPPSITVTAMDVSFKMMRGQQRKTWFNKKISDVVKEIAGQYGISVVVDDSEEKLPTLSKGHESDFQFLQNMAVKLNFDFFIEGKRLNFRKKFQNKTPILALDFSSHFRGMRIEQNLSEQVSSVEVRGWDVKAQKPIVGKSGQVKKTSSKTKTGPNILAEIGGNHVEYVYANPVSAKEAKDMADAILNERALKLVTGEAECTGLPELRAGRFIDVERMGSVLSQPYYLTRVTHVLDEGGYITQIQFQGNVV